MRDDFAPPAGFVDASALCRGGIYLLVRRGEVVYVGSARGGMFTKLAALRGSDRPSWLPKIQFDRIYLREIHPDQVDAVRAELIAEFSPKHNADKFIRMVAAPPINLVRRI